ncbi:hypothetical protein J3R83DRAFT_12598 [Lanmaoa asiatica]|nr:hypothetical protein J3R83DRAFT_12598 [Lanmaoa asiatica]
MSNSYEWPSRFLDLKREIVSMTTQERLTASWNGVLIELATRTAEIAQAGTNFVPQVNFADLEKLTPNEIDVIKRKGSVVIRGVVDTKTAFGWKTELEEFIKANPHVEGLDLYPVYWTRPQVQARAHPNVLKASAWLNNLYHVKSGKKLEGVDLSVPLSYADRFRIRHPGTDWPNFPPHVDGTSTASRSWSDTERSLGGAIERWEDKTFRRCFEDILTGDWRQHDPYELEHRLDARSSLYGRPGQATVFRTFQGWLAMRFVGIDHPRHVLQSDDRTLSETAPTEGTLRVFPDVRLSNAYMILRPFFRPTVPENSPDILDPENWKFDISTPDFPGIWPVGSGYHGPLPTPKLHPHLRFQETMTSIPRVNPGDMVFWHCVRAPSIFQCSRLHTHRTPSSFQDVVHSIEREHIGTNDSAVMYISSIPKTPLNSEYINKQAQTFLEGQNPPDYAKLKEGTTYVGLGADVDVKEPISRVAMGLPIQVA